MEKYIEELAQVIQSTYLPIMRGDAVVGERRIYPNDAFRLAETLYEAGYKKTTNKQATWRLETDEECPNPMFKLVICSNCKESANNTYKFCPHCGYEMTRLMTEGVKFS